MSNQLKLAKLALKEHKYTMAYNAAAAVPVGLALGSNIPVLAVAVMGFVACQWAMNKGEKKDAEVALNKALKNEEKKLSFFGDDCPESLSRGVRAVLGGGVMINVMLATLAASDYAKDKLLTLESDKSDEKVVMVNKSDVVKPQADAKTYHYKPC